jgi:adenylate cyclase
MAKGLRERDKIKNMFSKFHGSSVADDILNSDLTRRGERKNVTVYFSDIRSFTDFTERHTAEEVVEMLNGYFEIMVGIIIKHNGVVDKFIGDAIMAVWGAPEPTDHDVHDAITACMEMRAGLVTYNEKRVAEGKEPILMGAGVHTGDVISGTIGSDERMEYTVIGDAVNTAARIEASTKEFGTDLLVSREVMEVVSDKFFAHKAGEIKAKGKSNLLELYIVDGVIHEDGTQEEIHTEYSRYNKQKGGSKIEVAS